LAANANIAIVVNAALRSTVAAAGRAAVVELVKVWSECEVLIFSEPDRHGDGGQAKQRGTERRADAPPHGAQMLRTLSRTLVSRPRAGRRGPRCAPGLARLHMRKSGFCKTGFLMDIEHINAIGHTLEDLTERTAALRGYL
jgi:hypothetical protein